MLKRLQFTNFKAWEKADLHCARVTGLFGTNSSGKTSILQFLLMLKQTKEATDRALSLELNGEYVQLGTFIDTIHRHDEKSVIAINVEFVRDNNLVLNDPAGGPKAVLVSAESFTLEANVASVKGAPRTKLLKYGIGDLKFSLQPQNGGDNQFELKLHETSPKSTFKFIRTQGRAWQLPGPVKIYAFPDQTRTYFQNAAFLSDLEAAFEQEMDHIFYLGPLREYPRRDYLWARSRPSDVGQRGEKVIDAILAATEAKETRNLRPKSRHKPFQDMIAHWLREMGLIHSFKVEEIAPGTNRWQARVQTKPDSVQVLLTDVGFGVSQVLPVITLLYYVPEGSTVILEQPEIHLHPLAQAHLADLILNVALHRKIQVILESHSEHLLLRLQRRIAEGTATPDDVKLYFCDAPRGKSNLVPLNLDMFGSIDNWPINFMGDAFGETFAAEKARLERMQANR